MSNPKPSYTPPPSVGHEIGVMFGFLGAMALAMTLYLMLWKGAQKRNEIKEQERRAALAQHGMGDRSMEKAGQDGM